MKSIHKENIEHIIDTPIHRRHDTPILLLHGAWHGAWCWQLWMDYFTALGYEVHAISLPGHGTSSLLKGHINFYTLGDYVDILASKVDAIAPTPVVIGHSMGGSIVQNYLSTHQLPGTVLMTSNPPYGILTMVLRLLRRFPTNTLKGLITFDTSISTPGLAYDLFLDAETTVDIRKLHKQLVRESFLVAIRLMFPIARLNGTRSPVLVIAAEKDMLITLVEHRRTAKRYGAELLVFDGQAHDLMVEPSSRCVIDKIDDWINNTLRLP